MNPPRLEIEFFPPIAAYCSFKSTCVGELVRACTTDRRKATSKWETATVWAKDGAARREELLARQSMRLSNTTGV